MKKVLTIAVVILLLLVAGVYLLIPRQITDTHYVKFKSTPGAAERFLAQKDKWKAWWPGTVNADGSFSYNEYTYLQSVPPLPNMVNIDMSNKSDSVSGRITILPLSKDSVGLAWESITNTSNNPFQKIRVYNNTRGFNSQIRQVLDSFRLFLEKTENVYGLTVTQEKVTDTLLVTTKKISDKSPTTEEAYQLIGQLRNYVDAQGAQAVNPPMLYVSYTEDNRIQTMVAIPVNKVLPGTPSIVFKRMVPGKILVTEIKGGPYTVKQAFAQLELYAEDNKKVAPAIPFEMLMTDRIQEKDTTKWVTRIYYPTL